MSKGRISFEEKFGKERLKTLFRTMSLSEISGLVCKHKVSKEDKENCKACKRTLYRAKERMEATERKEKTLQPIDKFDLIPEIQQFESYSKAKHIKEGSIKNMKAVLFKMWNWIRTATDEQGHPITELIETQRPIAWNQKHIQYILIKVDESNISRYQQIQALRRFFEANDRYNMLQNTLLKARRKDMRSPKGARRVKDRFTTEEYTDQIRPLLNKDELLTVDVHVALKCREGDREKGSLLNLKWENINWKDTFYGFSMVTISVYEPKTGGGTLWEHCPVDLWFSDVSTRLKEAYDKHTEEYIFPFNYTQYAKIWEKISKALGQDYEPHDCRRSPSGWLRDLGCSDLAIGEYDARSGQGKGYAGAGWENAEIYFQRYGKMNPLAIYDRTQVLDLSKFDGHIIKILANKIVVQTRENHEEKHNRTY